MKLHENDVINSWNSNYNSVLINDFEDLETFKVFGFKHPLLSSIYIHKGSKLHTIKQMQQLLNFELHSLTILRLS